MVNFTKLDQLDLALSSVKDVYCYQIEAAMHALFISLYIYVVFITAFHSLTKVRPDSMVWTRSKPTVLRAWRVSVLGSQTCVQHFHSRGSDSEPISVQWHYTFCFSPGSRRTTIPNLSTQLHGYKLLLIVHLDGGSQGLYILWTWQHHIV